MRAGGGERREVWERRGVDRWEREGEGWGREKRRKRGGVIKDILFSC